MRLKTQTAVLALALLAGAASAHHSPVAEYDEKKSITLKGIVTDYQWRNPHVFVYLDVSGRGDEIANWAIEWPSRIELRRSGWTRDSLQVGDTVTVEGRLSRENSHAAEGRTLILSAGKRLSAPDNERVPTSRTASHKPAPRWPDGHVQLGIGPGEVGYWANPSAVSLIENTGAKIPMNSDGLLRNLSDAAKVAPFQPWAKALYVYRQRALLKDDPMAKCLPPGGPRQFQVPYGVQILEEPERKRLFVMSGGGDRNWRLVYLDGRALPESDDTTPTYYGYSVGHWEQDTLILTTVGFNERFWFTNGGLPHTEKLHLTERLSRPDFDTLKYEVTVDDPGAYTRAWSGGWTLQWIPDQDIDEYFCDDNNQS